MARRLGWHLQQTQQETFVKCFEVTNYIKEAPTWMETVPQQDNAGRCSGDSFVKGLVLSSGCPVSGVEEGVEGAGKLAGEVLLLFVHRFLFYWRLVAHTESGYCRQGGEEH